MSDNKPDNGAQKSGPAKSSSTSASSTPADKTPGANNSGPADKPAAAPKNSADKSVSASAKAASPQKSADKPAPKQGSAQTAPAQKSTPTPAKAASASSSSASASRASAKPPGGGGHSARSGNGGGSGSGGSRSMALVVAIVALLLALAALAGAAWLYVHSQSQAQATDSQIDTATKNMKSQVQQQLGPRVDDMSRTLAGLNDQVDTMDQTLGQQGQTLDDVQATITQVQSQNNQLQDALGGNHQTFIEQRIAVLLETADQRLAIYHDPQGAIAALQSADEIIAGAGYPQLRPVREAIADETAELKSLPNPDIEGLALKLSQLIDRVPELPTEADVPASYTDGRGGQNSDSPDSRNDNDNSAGSQGNDNSFAGIDWQGQWQRISHRVGQALSGMISVRRANGTQNAPTLMAPDQSFFLVQNVQLSLRSARLALLDGNEAAYKASLSDAADMIRQFFDADASTTKGMLSTIDELASAELAWQAPDISNSLAQLRRVMNTSGSRASGASKASANANTSSNESRSNNDADSAAANDAPATSDSSANDEEPATGESADDQNTTDAGQGGA